VTVDNVRDEYQCEEVEMANSANDLHREARNCALLAAEWRRAAATRDAEIEFSETAVKLREAFEADLAEAVARRNARVMPALRAYNASITAAERAYAAARIG
jgi:hypothetical protein